MQKQTLLGAAISAALSFSATANEQKSTDIERITVTANKIEQPIEQALATVNIFTRTDIEKLNVRDIPSLLNNIAGVDVVRSGGFGQKASVFIRGATTKYTLVLVDGLRVSEASSGDVSFTNIPVNSVERIEVIKGARAAIYGSDAIAGVINIITRKAQNHTLSVTSGAHNYNSVQGAGFITQGALSLSYNLGYEDTDGYDVTEKDPTQAVTKDHDADGYRNRNFGFNFGYDAKELGEFNAIAQLSSGNADYDSSWGNDQYEFDNYNTKLAWQKRSEHLMQNAYVSLAQEENVQTGTANHDIYSTKRQEAEYRAVFAFSNELDITAGAAYLNEDLSSSSAKLSVNERDNQSLFTGVFYNNDRLMANVIVRTDDYEKQGRANTYTSAIGYKANKFVNIRFNHGTAFRVPTLTHRFVAESLYVLPGEDLKPEESINNELGLTLSTRWGTYDVAVFHNATDNLIVYSLDGTSNKYIPRNINKTTMQGVELSANVSAFGLEHSVNLTLLDAKDNTTGKALVRRPKTSFNYTLSKTWEKLDVSLAMQHRSSRPSIDFYDVNLSATKSFDLPAYTLFNLSANYSLLDSIKLNARVDNVTDKQYTTAGSALAADGSLLGYVPLGRQVFVGATFTF